MSVLYYKRLLVYFIFCSNPSEKRSASEVSDLRLQLHKRRGNLSRKEEEEEDSPYDSLENATIDNLNSEEDEEESASQRKRLVRRPVSSGGIVIQLTTAAIVSPGKKR